MLPEIAPGRPLGRRCTNWSFPCHDMHNGARWENKDIHRKGFRVWGLGWGVSQERGTLGTFRMYGQYIGFQSSPFGIIEAALRHSQIFEV